MELKIKMISLLLFLLFPLMVRGDELSLLLESIERENLLLRARREEMKALGFELKEQNLPENTSVEYSPFFRRGAEGIASSELIVTQEFDFPSLYVARDKAAKGKLNSAEREYMVDAREILIEAAMNYLSLVRLNRIRKLLDVRLMNSQNLADSFVKKASVGEATSVDVNTSRLEVMSVQQLILANETEVNSVRSALMVLNGYTPFDFKAENYPDWNFTDGSVVAPDSDAEVLLASSELESGKLEEKVAKQSWVPKLTLGYRRNTELEQASHGFVVGASFPLFTSSSKLKSAKARKAAADINLENARRKVRSEIESVSGELNLLRKSMEVFDIRLLDDTQRLLNKAVELGQMPVTDYFTELSVLNDRRMEYIEIEYEYYVKLCVLYKNKLFHNIK